MITTLWQFMKQKWSYIACLMKIPSTICVAFMSTHTPLSTLDSHHPAMLGDGDTRHKHTYTHTILDSQHPAMLGDGDTRRTHTHAHAHTHIHDYRFPSPCNARVVIRHAHTQTHTTLDSHHFCNASTHTQLEAQPFRPTSAPPSRCLEEVQTLE